MERKKLTILGIFVILFALFFIFDLEKFLSFDYIKDSQESFQGFYNENPILTIGLFFIIYVTVTALSFPGAAILTILAGALFGLIVGTIIVSFASAIGATIAMIFARYVFRDSVEKKFPDFVKKINKGIKEDGAFYLFTLRLIPAVPFFIINLGMGLTKIRVWTYYWVSQIGMFLGTIVYVNAGSEISKLDSLSGILSPSLLLAFVLLGVLPFILKYLVKFIKKHRSS